ncbi:hypothetical protein H4S02_003292 [Coemansia sp. RSA 2611]
MSFFVVTPLNAQNIPDGNSISIPKANIYDLSMLESKIREQIPGEFIVIHGDGYCVDDSMVKDLACTSGPSPVDARKL